MADRVNTRVKQLEDNGLLVVNDGYRAKNVELSSTGLPFARAGNLNSGFDFDGADCFPEENLHRVGNKISAPGDVVFTSKGTVGRVAFVRPETPRFVYAPQLCFWRSLDYERIDPRFLYYWMCSEACVDQFNAVKAQTDMADYISLRDQRAMTVSLLGIDDQRAIARVLGQLDDKIELNRRMNETLEATARAIFRSWFVDFDPVVAKVDGRQPYGISAETAALFPEHFEQSDLDPIPLAWSRGTIADIAQYVNGRNFTKNATGAGRMVIRIAELNSGPGGSTAYNAVEADAVNTAYPDDILFAWSGSLDVYRWHRDEALINQHIFKVICNVYPKWFVYFQLQEAMPFFQHIAAGKATTMGHIKRSHLSEATIALPTQPLLQRGTEAIQPMYDRIHRNERESITLAGIRDALLPGLLSGEIRLREAKAVLEEVV